jgi:hypothetical protein
MALRRAQRSDGGHVRTIARQPQRDPAPDASLARRAGHDRYFAVQIIHRVLLSRSLAPLTVTLTTPAATVERA